MNIDDNATLQALKQKYSRAFYILIIIILICHISVFVMLLNKDSNDLSSTGESNTLATPPTRVDTVSRRLLSLENRLVKIQKEIQFIQQALKTFPRYRDECHEK